MFKKIESAVVQKDQEAGRRRRRASKGKKGSRKGSRKASRKASRRGSRKARK